MHLRPTMTRIFNRCTRSATFMWLVAAALIIATATAFAQSTVTATVSGTVTDPTGAIVQGAAVTIINEVTSDVRETETNKSGVFAVPNLNPSTYSVKVVAKGFAPKEITGIELHVGELRVGGRVLRE